MKSILYAGKGQHIGLHDITDAIIFDRQVHSIADSECVFGTCTIYTTYYDSDGIPINIKGIDDVTLVHRKEPYKGKYQLSKHKQTNFQPVEGMTTYTRNE